ncbi:MAG: hypothetical protein WCB14_09700, partial [Candidatus Acidiferrales bacterium]
ELGARDVKSKNDVGGTSESAIALCGNLTDGSSEGAASGAPTEEKTSVCLTMTARKIRLSF